MAPPRPAQVSPGPHLYVGPMCDATVCSVRLVCHFSTDMRAHMHLLSLLMCRIGLKLAACYLLGTAYLRSLSLLSLLSRAPRALTLSRPRTQTQQVGTNNEERCPPPLPAISVLTLRDPTLSPDRARSTQARSTLRYSYRDSES